MTNSDEISCARKAMQPLTATKQLSEGKYALKSFCSINTAGTREYGKAEI
jgi:hypothetical protein